MRILTAGLGVFCAVLLAACGGGAGGGGSTPNTPTAQTTTRVYVVNSGSNTVSVMDVASNTVVATIAVGNFPTAIAVDNTHNRAYVANTGANTLSVIDSTSNQTLTTVATGNNPVGVAVNPLTRRVYVSNSASNTVSVIDGNSNALLASIAVGDSPFGITVNPATNKVYVANNVGNTVSAIDALTNTVEATIATGFSPFGIAVDPATAKLYVSEGSSNLVNVINTTTNSSMASIGVGMFPRGLAINPNDNKVYVAQSIGNQHQIYMIGTDDSVLGVSGARPGPIAVAINPQNNYVYIANFTDNSINVVNPIGFGTSASFIATVAVGTAPRGIAIVIPNQPLPQYPANPGLGIRWTVPAAQATDTANYSSIATDQNLYVAVGAGGFINTSPDGIVWTSRSSGTSNDLKHIAFLNGQFVALGAAGTLLTSPDGLTWTARTSGTAAQLNGLAFGAGQYVAVGAGGAVLTSPDAVAWTALAPQTTANLTSITFGNSQFIAVGDAGAAIASADGNIWTSLYSVTYAATRNPGTSSNYTAYLSAIQFFNGKFIISGNMDCFITSADGINWTLAAAGTWGSVAWTPMTSPSALNLGNGTLIWSNPVASSIFLTSTDATTWTTRSRPLIAGNYQAMPTSITYAKGQYVGVGEGGLKAVSADGLEWNYINQGGFSGNSVAYGNGTFVGLQYPFISHSTDGISAITYSGLGSYYSSVPLLSNITPWDVRYVNGMFIALCNGGRLVTSPDGIRWTERFIQSWPNNIGQLYAVTYGNGLYAVAGSGIIATSPDTINWTIHPVGDPSLPAKSVYDIQFINNQFIAVGELGLMVTSSDGVNWSEPAITLSFNRPPGIGNNAPHYTALFRRISYGNGLYVMVGQNYMASYYGFYHSVLTSPDGIHWTERADTEESVQNGLSNVLNPYRVIFAGGRFVLLDMAGKVLTSIDGIHWADRTPANLPVRAGGHSFYDVIYANGKLVLVGTQTLISQ